MPRAPLLAPADIERRLLGLPAWRLGDSGLVRTVRLRDFRAAVELLSRLVPTADEHDHHPDVTIHWDTLTLRLWTHAAGGITERDFRLIEAIDPLLDEGVAPG